MCFRTRSRETRTRNTNIPWRPGPGDFSSDNFGSGGKVLEIIMVQIVLAYTVRHAKTVEFVSHSL